MQNHTVIRARHRLTVLGLLASISLFSIASIPATTAQASTPTNSIMVASDTTPDGVIGWD